MTQLRVLDHGELLTFGFDDLLKYHGRSSIAGVAHGFAVMRLALPLLDGGRPPERADIKIESAFPGEGTQDAFEMVTRAITGNRYRLAPEAVPADAPAGPGGRFFFTFAYRGTTVDLQLRPGFVSHEFVELVRRGATTAAEAQTLVRTKNEMAGRLLALPVDEVYTADVR